MQSDSSEASTLVDEAKQYIATHLDKPMTMQSIADALYISRTRLCMAFRNVTGSSIGRFIRMVRVQRAQTLMASTEDSLHDIALAVGYQRQGSFSEVFKEIVGCTPTEWRKPHSPIDRTNTERDQGSYHP